jgi:hypothetical protein
LQEEEDITYLWNTLHAVGALQTLEDDVNADIDAFYYTSWNFSYPVLEWGEDGQDDLQDYLDLLIGTHRVDEVLPWENAKASITGQEDHTFVLPGSNLTSHSIDDPVPHSTAKLLQGLGSIMLLVNTVFVILVTWLAKRQKKKFAKLPPGLVTVEGVESMLQETRQHVAQHSLQVRAAPVARPASPAKPLFPNASPAPNQKKADEDRLVQEATKDPRVLRKQLSSRQYSYRSLLAANDASAEMEDDDSERIESM